MYGRHRRALTTLMLGNEEQIVFSEEEKYSFDEEQALHENKYLAGVNARQQSGFGRDEQDWERYRRVVTAKKSSLPAAVSSHARTAARGQRARVLNFWSTSSAVGAYP